MSCTWRRPNYKYHTRNQIYNIMQHTWLVNIVVYDDLLQQKKKYNWKELQCITETAITAISQFIVLSIRITVVVRKPCENILDIFNRHFKLMKHWYLFRFISLSLLPPEYLVSCNSVNIRMWFIVYIAKIRTKLREEITNFNFSYFVMELVNNVTWRLPIGKMDRSMIIIDILFVSLSHTHTHTLSILHYRLLNENREKVNHVKRGLSSRHTEKCLSWGWFYLQNNMNGFLALFFLRCN